MSNSGYWVVEYEFKDDYGWGSNGDIAGGADKNSALAVAESLRGKTLSDMLTMPGADVWTIPDVSSGNLPVVAAEVVYFDGEETQRDTATLIRF